jgi:hypothetical protein
LTHWLIHLTSSVVAANQMRRLPNPNRRRG